MGDFAAKFDEHEIKLCDALGVGPGDVLVHLEDRSQLLLMVGCIVGELVEQLDPKYDDVFVKNISGRVINPYEGLPTDKQLQQANIIVVPAPIDSTEEQFPSPSWVLRFPDGVDRKDFMPYLRGYLDGVGGCWKVRPTNPA